MHRRRCPLRPRSPVAQAGAAPDSPRSRPRRPAALAAHRGRWQAQGGARPSPRRGRLRPRGPAVWRALVAAVAVLAATGGGLLGAAAAAGAPPLRHVFVIILENESASTTFAPGSPAPYLSQTLRSDGAYLPNYYSTGHESNDNYIAMISGQASGA